MRGQPEAGRGTRVMGTCRTAATKGRGAGARLSRLSFVKGNNDRTTESQTGGGWKGAPGIISSNPLLKQVPQSRLDGMASRWIWNVSKEGDSAASASLGSLNQGSLNLRTKVSPHIQVEFAICAHWHSSCHWAHPPDPLFSY